MDPEDYFEYNERERLRRDHNGRIPPVTLDTIDQEEYDEEEYRDERDHDTHWIF